MIDIVFEFNSEMVLVRVHGKTVLFANANTEINRFTTIQGLRLDKTGVIKEFPDLKDDFEWRTKAINRFEEKIKSFSNEEDIVNYIIDDLEKFGYIPRYKQKKGFRNSKL